MFDDNHVAYGLLSAAESEELDQYFYSFPTPKQSLLLD